MDIPFWLVFFRLIKYSETCTSVFSGKNGKLEDLDNPKSANSKATPKVFPMSELCEVVATV